MNEVIKTINNLRSIRKFSEEIINDDKLKIILNSAIRAANASSMQSYSMIVVKEREIMKSLTGYTGSVAIVYCVDYFRYLKLAEYLDHSYDVFDIISFITGTIDTILAAQTSVIAAKSMDIDSLITNGVNRMGLDNAFEILNLPEKGCFPLITVIFGYSNEKSKKKHGRLNDSSIIHYNKYSKLTEENIRTLVETYNNYDNPLGLINNWEELGLKNYLDWLFTRWLGSNNLNSTNDGLKSFYDILKKIGFLKYSNFKM
ncbi:MAG: nitroreductase family protein [Candidatus Lokiarchaeota archaeon]|nr:nitroreductase family protein [Candidatus Lokiarchaeota archaeon]